MLPIYLDYNATTPIDPRVRAAMTPFLDQEFGNPSSSHAYGRAARQAVDSARTQLAAFIGAQADEVIFTGGGTEASNLAIKGCVAHALSGFLARLLGRGAHVITSTIEHPATLQPCDFLRRHGCSITQLPVDGSGLIDPESVRRTITRRTKLITIMHSNNEIGTLQQIREIARIAREARVLVHTDAAQSTGKVTIDVNELGVDLMTIAGHKLYAPKGIGALFVRRGVRLEPLIHGAGHEHGLRAGTENVPYIVGLGMAAQVAQEDLPAATTRLQTLRDRLEQQLRDRLGDRISLNGHRDRRLPNTLNVSIRCCVGADLLARVPEVAASTGSACHEGKISQSPVLCAMGVPPETGQGAIRLSVGRFTTTDEVDRAAELLSNAAR